MTEKEYDGFLDHLRLKGMRKTWAVDTQDGGIVCLWFGETQLILHYFVEDNGEVVAELYGEVGEVQTMLRGRDVNTRTTEPKKRASVSETRKNLAYWLKHLPVEVTRDGKTLAVLVAP